MDKDDSKTAPLSPDKLLKKTIEDLLKDEQLDAGLLDVLSANILLPTPAETAVADAVKAIEKLATKRAKEPTNDSTDHD